MENTLDIQLEKVKKVKRSEIQGKKPQFPTFLYNDDEYFDIERVTRRWPLITGCPDIYTERYRTYVQGYQWTGRNTIPVYDALIAPKYCWIGKIIHWPFTRMGGPQISITGTYGTGKSNLMNLILAFWKGLENIRILMFNDRRMEIRNLAAHGYFNKDGKFKPFEFEIWLPEGYEWLKGIPLWETRNNVNLRRYKTADEIIESMSTKKFTVVYDECFDQSSRLRLWIDLMQIIGEEITPSKNYVFAHHEFSSLISEVPHRSIYQLTQDAANIALNLRKDRIGMITTFHMTQEVFYRVSQKFGYVCIKRPVRRKRMTYAESDAQNFPITDVNITRGGRWMTHTIKMFPELPDRYRVIPKREKWIYPELEPSGKILDKQKQKPNIMNDPRNQRIAQMRAQGRTWDHISQEEGISISAVYQRAKRMKIVKKRTD